MYAKFGAKMLFEPGRIGPGDILCKSKEAGQLLLKIPRQEIDVILCSIRLYFWFR
jgi:hypothetical protein